MNSKNKILHNCKIERKINVLVLCGGLGTRISKITKKTPKPLIKVNNKPFIYFVIMNLFRQGFTDFYLLTYYKHDKFSKFVKYFKKNKKININIIKEKKKLDTGGAIINATKIIKNNKDFLVINGDTYHDINFLELISLFKKSNKKILLPIIKKSNESKKLLGLSLNKKNKIIFKKKSKYMNSGIYIFKNNYFSKESVSKISFEEDILFKVIKKGHLRGKLYNEKYIDIGSYKSLNKIESFIKKNFINKQILFIDRDNTLNYDKGYTYKLNDAKIIKNNISYIKNNFSNSLKYIVSNQAGIAKKKFTIQNFKSFMEYLDKTLSKNDLYINDIFYCPHHPDAKVKFFKKNCSYRKPNIKMILDLKKKYDLNLNKSFFIGDSDIDKFTAKNAKIKFYSTSEF